MFLIQGFENFRDRAADDFSWAHKKVFRALNEGFKKLNISRNRRNS